MTDSVSDTEPTASQRRLWRLVLYACLAVLAGVAFLAFVVNPWVDAEADRRADERVSSALVDSGGDEPEAPPPVLVEDVERALSDSASRRPCDAADTSVEEGDVVPGARLVELGRSAAPMYVVAHPNLDVELVLGREGGVLAGVESLEPVFDLGASTRAEHDGGLLSGAYDPMGEWLYLYRSVPGSKTQLSAHRVGDDGLPEMDHVVILELDQPSPQHDGGGLAFGPDGHLWLATGDGGGLGDPWPNAQDPNSLLGKLLRIEPDPESGTYRVPGDNPFVGEPEARPEIFASGLRNPWRMSFDAATGTLFLPDPGQSCWEEVNVVNSPVASGGRNYGWDELEGTHPFQTPPIKPEEPAEVTDPTVEYRHGAGKCAITGGFVYRGAALPDLVGAWLHADWCSDDIWALSQTADGVWRRAPLGLEVGRVVAVAPDASGEPIVASLFEGEDEDPGVIHRIVPG